MDELGNIVYGKTIPCPEKGCLQDSFNAYQRGDPFIRSRGVTQPSQTFETVVKVPGLTKAFNLAKAIANGDADFIWLLIYGGVGNCKTHLCHAIAKKMIDRGVTTEMIPAAELFSKLRQAIGENKCDEVSQYYKEIYALVLDDWGVEYGTEFERARFDEIMAARYANARVTVVTTNKDITEIPERVRSRFEDVVMARIVENKAGDYRKVSR